MGLDMYLYLRDYKSRHHYINRYNLEYPKELKELGDEILERNFMSASTQYQVGYWRKAYAIHNWFVKNCQNGEDDCKEYYISIDDLEKLGEVVVKVIYNHSLASELLPTYDDKYDEWYFKDLEYTRDLLIKVLPIAEEYPYDIVYSSSW